MIASWELSCKVNTLHPPPGKKKKPRHRNDHHSDRPDSGVKNKLRRSISCEALLLNVPDEVVDDFDFLLLYAIDLMCLPDFNPFDQRGDNL